MTAKIIPFNRPAPIPEAQGQPPVVVAFSACSLWVVGTREQLVRYGMAAEDQFPKPPRRVAYWHDGPTIYARRGGLWDLTRHYGAMQDRCVDDPIANSAMRVLESSEVSRSLVALTAMRSRFILSERDGWQDRKAELHQFDKAIEQLVGAAIAMMKPKDN